MNSSFCVHGLKTGTIGPGDNITDILLCASEPVGGIHDGDIVIIAESALATAEGNVIQLAGVKPSPEAIRLADRYTMDPRLVEVVLRESETVVGGIPGFLLCLKNGTLLPNAGVDGSNAPPGTVVTLPTDPDTSAESIRLEVMERTGKRIGVVIADSRTHAMRLGCGGVAIGCSGFVAVWDERGRPDLFGRPLEVTQRAVADNIASAAELVFGESNESIPLAILRGLDIPLTDAKGIESIDARECLFMGAALNADPSFFNEKRKS